MAASGKALAIIPARGGSKRVPQKNIREICGKPLLAYTIETALSASDLFHAVIVSTDDEKTAGVALQYGAEVPFLRPSELAGDTVSTAPVLQHAVNFIEQRDNIKFDWVCLLQPTAPFRSQEDIREVMRLAMQGGCDSVISVVQVFATHPVLMKKIEDNRLLPFCVEEKEGTRSQDYAPPAYMRNGAIYVTKRDVLMNRNSIWGDCIRPYVMPEERSLDVNSELDMALIETCMKAGSKEKL